MQLGRRDECNHVGRAQAQPSSADGTGCDQARADAFVDDAGEPDIHDRAQALVECVGRGHLVTARGGRVSELPRPER
jgi:hypothetical protein